MAAEDTAEDEITQFTDVQHIRSKEMYAGQLEPVLYKNMHLMNEKGLFYMKNTHQVPALLKCFDEIIVNAVDHAKDPKNKVTTIMVSFEDGKIKVYNNGKGIKITKQNVVIDGKTVSMYIPEIVFGVTKTGSNLEKERSNTKAGTNGIGAKIANIHSTKFIVRTVTSKKQFTKTWYNGMTECTDAKIEKTDSEDYTLVNFTPDYRNFKYDVVEVSGIEDRVMPNQEDHLVITDWLRLRMHYVAAYAGNNITVSFNGDIIESNTPELFGLQLLSVYPDEIYKDIYTVTSKITSKHEDCKKFPINISVFMLPSGEKINKNLLPQSISIINGTVSSAGNHINLFMDKVISKVVTKIKVARKTDKCTNTEAMGGIHFIISGAIPGVTWDSQTKNKVNIPTEYFNTYDLTQKYTNECISGIYQRFFKQDVKTSKKVEQDKYYPARFANTKKKDSTMLLVAEGDSAVTFLKAGLGVNQKNKDIGAPNVNYCGILSIQGVLTNVEKALNTKVNERGNSVITNIEKVTGNLRFAKIVDAFGLDYRKKYETAQEIDTLNYGRMILCVDQDVDGVGKIASLLLVWINKFWPALLHNGIIGRFVTPLIKVFTKKNLDRPILEFRYQSEFDAYIEDNEIDMSKHIVKYYKGLATNTEEDVADMFKPDKFHKNVQIYTMDKDNASDHIEAYFQKDSSYRKEVLSTPVKYFSKEAAKRHYEEKVIPMVRQQLSIDTKAYKHDAIERQLPHIIDGLNPSRRKAITGAIKNMKSTSDLKKVFQLCGFVASELHYHHGDFSLNKTITCMAQAFVGAYNYPLLIGKGQFGSRHGDEPGVPRYISVGLSPLVKILFPPEDTHILPHVFEDNERAEPKYYVPVVPLSVIESYNIVTEAWNHKGYGRNINQVINLVYRYLDNEKEIINMSEKLYDARIVTDALKAELKNMGIKLKVNSSRYTGETINMGGVEVSLGAYEVLGENKLVITDLPIGVKTYTFINSIKNKMKKQKSFVVTKILNNSTNNDVSLEIHLSVPVSSLTSKNTKFDPVISTLNLKKSLKPALNYFSHNRSVLAYGDQYIGSLFTWLHARAKLYVKRVERRNILIELLILEESESIRFIQLSDKLNLKKKKDEAEVVKILEENDFKMIDKTTLHSPGFIENDELYTIITSGKNASFNYLLNLRVLDLVISEVDKREKRIQSLIKDLEKNKGYLEETPPCKSLWSEEIDKFLKATGITVTDDSSDDEGDDDESYDDGDEEDDYEETPEDETEDV